MNAYLAVIDKLYELLDEDENVNTVRKGGVIDVDKNNCFNLAHINILNAVFDKATIGFQCAVFAMALRDTVNDTTKDKWGENDNENTNLDTTLYILHTLYQKLLKIDDTFQLVSVENPEPFTEAHSNVVDGWVMRFNVVFIESDNGAC